VIVNDEMRGRDRFYYIIIHTVDVGLYFQRHPISETTPEKRERANAVEIA